MKTFLLKFRKGEPIEIDADSFRARVDGLVDFVREREIILTVPQSAILLIGTPDPVTEYRLPNPSKFPDAGLDSPPTLPATGIHWSPVTENEDDAVEP